MHVLFSNNTDIYTRFNNYIIQIHAESENYELELKDGAVHVDGMKNPPIRLQFGMVHDIHTYIHTYIYMEPCGQILFQCF